MRLIDADKLVTGETFYGDVIVLNDGEAYLKIKDLIKFIDKQPTIEAVPVVHGEWLSDLDENGKLKTTWRKCSMCGCLNYSKKPNFCPNCGAKMDGKAV